MYCKESVRNQVIGVIIWVFQPNMPEGKPYLSFFSIKIPNKYTKYVNKNKHENTLGRKIWIKLKKPHELSSDINTKELQHLG